MSLTERFEAYIEAYAAQDLDAVSDMLADDVRLRDWKISVTGKELAVAETRKNFAAAERIEIDILTTYAAPSAVAGELKIVVDGTEELHVVDVLAFGDDGRIESIRAYLGRPD